MPNSLRSSAWADAASRVTIMSVRNMPHVLTSFRRVDKQIRQQRLTGERLQQLDEVRLVSRRQAERRELRVLDDAARERIPAALIVELDDVGERRDLTGVHVRRGQRDVAQALRAEQPLLRIVLYESGQLAGCRVVRERPGRVERARQ